MKYNIPQITARFDAGETLKYIFFWGHQPNKDGSIGQSCFSQWWAEPFEVDNLRYPTAEHWMMAEKARLFEDMDVREKIMAAKSPAEAKKLGREVKHFDPIIWGQERYNIVLEGNLHKFGQHEALKGFLLNTGERVLVEASPVDNIWGIGLAKDSPNIENPHTWKGLNLLGFALMEVRDRLR